MSDRSTLIDKLQSSADSRASYIRSKINVLIPAQLHALRLGKGWTQKRFAGETEMKQSRVSAMEQPGAVNFNMETLIRSAAAHKVGLVVAFVPFSEMLKWENEFSQDSFNVAAIDEDIEFIQPTRAHTWHYVSPARQFVRRRPTLEPVNEFIIRESNSTTSPSITMNIFEPYTFEMPGNTEQTGGDYA